MQITIDKAIPLAVAILNVLVVIVLYSSKTGFRSRANRDLAHFLILISLMMGLFVFDSMVTSERPLLILLDDLVPEYLIPVLLLYYFVRLSTLCDYLPTYGWWLLLPFILTTVINVYISLSAEFKLYNLPFSLDDPLLREYYFYEYTGAVLYGLLLMAFNYWVVRNRLETTRATTAWVRTFYWLMAGAMGVWSLSYVADVMRPESSEPYIWTAVSLILLIFIYQGVLRQQLQERSFDKFSLVNPPPVAVTLALATVNKPGAGSATDAPLIKARTDERYLPLLEELMEGRQLYRQAELSREKVADQLGISPGYLSGLLSEHATTNFSELVNGYRVADVKRMLVDPDYANYRLVSIGLEAGFNSKSAFYQAFKKETGQTPSAYQAAHGAPLDRSGTPEG